MGFLFLVIVLLVALLFWVLASWRADNKESSRTIIYQPAPRKTNLNLPPIEPLPLPQTLRHDIDTPDIVHNTPSNPAPPPTTEFKECPHCYRVLPVTEFRTNSNTEDGLTRWCTLCLASHKQTTRGDLKYCSRCKQNRKKTSFFTSKKTPDRLSKWCKYCHKEFQKRRQ